MPKIEIKRFYGAGYDAEFEKNFAIILSTFKFTDKTTNSSSYSCPSTEWVNCMPSVGPNGYEEPAQCKSEYLTWAKQNCPNFKGAAR